MSWPHALAPGHKRGVLFSQVSLNTEPFVDDVPLFARAPSPFAQILALFPNGKVPAHFDRKSDSACKRELSEGLAYGPATLRILCR